MRRKQQLRCLAVGAALAGTVLAGCDWGSLPVGTDLPGVGADDAAAVDAPTVATDTGGEGTVTVPSAVAVDPTSADDAAVTPLAVAPATSAEDAVAPAAAEAVAPDVASLFPDATEIGDLLERFGITLPDLGDLPDFGELPDFADLPDPSEVFARFEALLPDLSDLVARFQDVLPSFPGFPGGSDTPTDAVTTPTAADAAASSSTAPDLSSLADSLPSGVDVGSVFGA